tara:strand:- start:2303 stop:4120 length:1818 start_codon:yes stop_codon:yes gene_type:complete
MKEIIETITGASVPLSECRKIKDGYYKIGDVTIKDSGDCFFMEERNKYTRLETGYIEYDVRLQKYVYKSTAPLFKGVVGIDSNENLILGYFSKDENTYYETIFDKDLTHYITLLTKDYLIKSNIYLENLEDGMYYHRQSISTSKFIKLVNPNNSYKRNLPYDSNGRMSGLIEKYNNLYKPIYSPVCEKYGEFMKDLTFGLEFETSVGSIPQSRCDTLGLMPLRDGSVEGLEYVTIPLQGKKGVQTVIDSIKELDTKTEFSEKCSLHIHIGNIPRTEGFFLAMYKMLFLFQDSIFEMFPVYKKTNYGYKKKHYTKPLDFKNTIMLMDGKINRHNMRKNFSILYNHLSMGSDYKDADYSLDNVHSHPSDPEGRSKWNIRTRYHWVNFIPLLFGNKQTIEFRVHTPTTDVNKVMNYMLLCSSIVNYTIENEKNILENFGSVSDISLGSLVYDNLNKSKVTDYKKLYSYFQEYIDNRKSHFYRAACKGIINEDESNFQIFPRLRWDPKKDNKIKFFNNRKEDVKKFSKPSLGRYIPTSDDRRVSFRTPVSSNSFSNSDNIVFRGGVDIQSTDEGIESGIQSIERIRAEAHERSRLTTIRGSQELDVNGF